MNKKHIFFKHGLFIFMIIMSVSSVYCQFYTVLPPKEEAAKNPVQDSLKSLSPDLAIESPAIRLEEDDNEEEQINNYRVFATLRQRQFLSLPIDTIKINSLYGYRADPFTGKRRFHKGIDLNANYNYVYSIMPGRVIKAGKNKGLGYFVQIDHGDFKSIYGHLFTLLVDKKDIVTAGQIIGISGSSGRSTGEHLHFQLSFQGKTINPEPILKFLQGVTDAAHEGLKTIQNSSANLVPVPPAKKTQEKQVQPAIIHYNSQKL